MTEAPHYLRTGGSSAAAFRSAYAAAFGVFLDDGSETALRTAYELGRDAVDQVGLLELAHIHNAVLVSALRGCPEASDSLRIGNAASDFLLEALSAYEMVRRGFGEARDAVADERRNASMIRQLSTLLADASLAVRAHSSIDEMLQIVAEQACELARAAWCIAHAQNAPILPAPILVTAGPEPQGISNIIEEAYSAFGALTRTTDVVRVSAQSAAPEVIAVPLAALNGRTVGFLAIGAGAEHTFTELERALLIHIGQMTAASLERAIHYWG